MSDLVERLLTLPRRDLDNPALREEAAAEIKNLRSQLAEAKGVLRAVFDSSLPDGSLREAIERFLAVTK